ncbi:BolA family protein [Candidatus Tisiphia endosymbiont of Nemotelus uliginosus]|uniref:BolA family protein n=1 Tax=Candidatus Tisiphia endosymbiont of Nemotelus uliginosus TaxID=3077926 RepID=UPI0035C88A66
MTRSNRIKSKLDVLKPHYCQIIDESSKHSAHTGGTIESHFIIKISADIFTGKTLLTQHRIINELLADELANGLHALTINIKT